MFENIKIEDKAIDKINKEKDLTKEQKSIAACIICGGNYDMGINFVEGCKEFKRTGKSSYMKFHKY